MDPYMLQKLEFDYLWKSKSLQLIRDFFRIMLGVYQIVMFKIA